MRRRRIRIVLDLPWALWAVRAALACITTVNWALMLDAKRRGHRVPMLYRSGVRYREQPPETFRDYRDVLSRGYGDCDQLAAYRVAELRMQGVHAKAVPRQVRPDLIHVVVQHPDGTIEDPSRKLGMGK